jgi:hypothetical protein
VLLLALSCLFSCLCASPILPSINPISISNVKQHSNSNHNLMQTGQGQSLFGEGGWCVQSMCLFCTQTKDPWPINSWYMSKYKYNIERDVTLSWLILEAPQEKRLSKCSRCQSLFYKICINFGAQHWIKIKWYKYKIDISSHIMIDSEGAKGIERIEKLNTYLVLEQLENKVRLLILLNCHKIFYSIQHIKQRMWMGPLLIQNLVHCVCVEQQFVSSSIFSTRWQGQYWSHAKILNYS